MCKGTDFWDYVQDATADTLTNDEGSSGIKSEMSNIDVSIPVGASYEWRNIVVDARYHFGLMHAIKNQDVRRRYLLLTVGYRFGL